MGKYKHNLIHKVKEKFGVSHLYFYRGVKMVDHFDHLHRKTYEIPIDIAICSLKGNRKNVYKNKKSILVKSKFTHKELEQILVVLSGLPHPKSRGFYCPHNAYSYHRSSAVSKEVLFESSDSLFSDLQSLKEASFIAYLAGL